MFPISNAAVSQLGIGGKNRTIDWFGTLTTESGTVYDITTDIIAQGSGSITQKIPLPFIGSAQSSLLKIHLLMSDVDPKTLKNARIELFVRIDVPEGLDRPFTWGDAVNYLWSDALNRTWEGVGPLDSTVPMGVFYVVDAKRHLHSIKIEARDGMMRFETDLPGMDSTSRTVYGWASWACNACGITFGMTADEVKELPNGNRSFVYAVLDSKIPTYRYLLEQLAAAVGSIAIMNRAGKLVFRKLNSRSVAELTTDDRFTSDYEDTQSTYTGLWLQHKTKAVQEYYKNVPAAEDNGLVIDLKDNPFLQISNDSARKSALQSIIDSVAGFAFTPFSATIPCHPEFDILDVITFSGGHAPAGCVAPLTDITWTINGGVNLKCATPEEQVDPYRRNTPTDVVSGSRVSGGDFWIKVAASPETGTEVAAGEESGTDLTVTCATDNTTMQIAWTCGYALSGDSTIAVDIYVDDKMIYSVTEDQPAGNRLINVTTGHAVSQKGEYNIKAVIREVPE